MKRLKPVAALLTLSACQPALVEDKPKELTGRYQMTSAGSGAVWVLDSQEGAIQFCAPTDGKPDSEGWKNVTFTCSASQNVP